MNVNLIILLKKYLYTNALKLCLKIGNEEIRKSKVNMKNFEQDLINNLNTQFLLDLTYNFNRLLKLSIYKIVNL